MSKTMTRFLSLLLIAVLAISLCGCGGEGKRQSPTKSSWKTMSSSIRTRAS